MPNNFVNGRTFRERLFSRLIIDPGGCVLWAGATDPKGYGKISMNGRSQLVHRVMYEMFAGPIPDGLQLDHLCRVRHCANVDHLELVTPRVNTLRGIGVSAVNAVRTHCPEGHAYDEANTYRSPCGDRYCRACHRERERGKGRPR